MFIAITLILWGAYVLMMHKRHREKFKLSKELLPLIFIGLISMGCLGVNFVASAVPSLNDGIGIQNFIAYGIIGENNWSVDLFNSYFINSIYINLFLIFLYCLLRVVEKSK
jgi:hypothetical protein